MKNAIYVGKPTPDLHYGQTGTYYPRAEGFTPDWDLCGLHSVEPSDMYFPGESKQQCKRGYPINPAWKTAKYGIEEANFTSLHAAIQLEKERLTSRRIAAMVNNGSDTPDPVDSVPPAGDQTLL